MNKIEYKGKTILDIDAVNNAVTKTENQVSSTTITEIRVVTAYPQVEEQGVLYIKVEPTNP